MITIHDPDGRAVCDVDLHTLVGPVAGEGVIFYADLGREQRQPIRVPVRVPVVPDIDRHILAKAESGLLTMSDWHCGSSHCRAGWAVHLAGEAGYALEKRFGPGVAGMLIYAASRPGKAVPDFDCEDDEAIASLRADAAEAEGGTQ